MAIFTVLLEAMAKHWHEMCCVKLGIPVQKLVIDDAAV